MNFCLAIARYDRYDVIIKKHKNQALLGQGLPVEPVEVCQETTVEVGSSRYNL